MKEIRHHGQSGRYQHTRIGINGRLDSIQCAILLAKLERFDWEVAERARIGARYDELLKGLEPAVRLLRLRPDRTSVFAQYTIQVSDRAGLEAALKAEGIPTAIHYPKPLHQQPAYSTGWENVSFPVAERLAQEVISLPMHPYLDAATQDKIAAAVRKAVAR
jgi:UDP-2-acetamido-2-deoxy-ribo-hexuluronate aminotransferase